MTEKRHKRGTKLQVAERVTAIAALRLQGKEHPEILQYCASRGWPCSLRGVYYYIQKADLLIGKYAQSNQRSLFGQRIARRNALWTQAMENGDLALALQIEKDQTRLLNLYPPPPTPQAVGPPLQVNNGTPALSEEDREAIRRLALARLGEADPEPISVRGSPADRQGLPQPPEDSERRGNAAGRLAGETLAVTTSSDAAAVLQTERTVLAGPPGPGEERWVCTSCGLRYRRQPGVPWQGCPACNAP
jgi:hypothetical protein